MCLTVVRGIVGLHSTRGDTSKNDETNRLKTEGPQVHPGMPHRFRISIDLRSIKEVAERESTASCTPATQLAVYRL